MIRTFVDHKKQPHTLDLDAVLVDGRPCLSVQAMEQYVQFETVQGAAITCELTQFWREVAGPGLDEREAGLLLVDCLMRQVVLQRTSSALHEVMSLLTRTTTLPAEVPSFAWLTTRLDPLARQAMSAYDGSESMTEMLARILHQEPATIRQWARQLGMDVSPAPTPSSEAGATPAVVETAPPGAPGVSESAGDEVPGASIESRKQFTWSPARIQQLEEALKTCNGATVAERARQIAGQCCWPVEKVRSKLYEMQRQHRSGQSVAREPEQAETAKEDDQHAHQREAIFM